MVKFIGNGPGSFATSLRRLLPHKSPLAQVKPPNLIGSLLDHEEIAFRVLEPFRTRTILELSPSHDSASHCVVHDLIRIIGSILAHYIPLAVCKKVAAARNIRYLAILAGVLMLVIIAVWIYMGLQSS
jgi:hypothetical protein